MDGLQASRHFISHSFPCQPGARNIAFFQVGLVLVPEQGERDVEKLSRERRELIER